MADYRSMFDSAYIGAWNLVDKKGRPREVTVTITDVKAETLNNGKSKNKKPVVYFAGSPLGIVINKTNAKAIAGMYGNDTTQWIGKLITLFPTQVQFGGETKDGIRVRPGIPKGGATPDGITAGPPPVPGEPAPESIVPAEPDADGVVS